MRTLLIVVFCLSGYCFSQDIPAENTPHQVVIRWKAPINEVYDGFNIYRADTCHGFVYLKAVGQVRTFTDRAVIGGETYTYKVRTVFNGVESVDSNVPSIVIPLT